MLTLSGSGAQLHLMDAVWGGEGEGPSAGEAQIGLIL